MKDRWEYKIYPDCVLSMSLELSNPTELDKYIHWCKGCRCIDDVFDLVIDILKAYESPIVKTKSLDKQFDEVIKYLKIFERRMDEFGKVLEG